MKRPLRKIKKQLGYYFKQLSFFSAIQFSTADFFRKIFNFHSKYNYSQTGEQMIIDNYLHHVSEGFYLDIGCNEPVKLSNTFSLYCRGWKGLCVDANENIIKKYKKVRPNDIAYCSAVSDSTEEKTYYEFEGSAVNTLDENVIDEWKKNWKFKSERKITPKTLNSILEELQLTNQHIDLMSVDVEGFDLNVLRSIDLVKYTPTLIVVELHKTSLLNLKENEVVNYLAQFGYHPVAFATVNGYFMKTN